MEIKFGNIRIGKKYYLRNFGEEFHFKVEARKGESDYLLKDLNTLENFMLSDVLKYGKGKDLLFKNLEEE